MAPVRSPLCPSARCQPGARLLGVVRADGTVAFVPEPPAIDAAFVRAARAARPPEARFRFASACRRGGCTQWTADRCGVVDEVIAAADAAAVATEPPPCAIRGECMWFVQRGARACCACAFVVTELAPAP